MANEGPPGVSPCPARCRRGEHAADRLVRPRRPAGAAVGPSDFPAGAALEKAPATPLLHALQQRLRPYQLAAGRVRVLPGRRYPSHRPRRWLSLRERPWCCTPSVTVVVSALAWRAHRRRCPPVGRVPTYGQRALGTTPLGAAYPPHRSAALPRDASASVAAVCSGIVLALL